MPRDDTEVVEGLFESWSERLPKSGWRPGQIHLEQRIAWLMEVRSWLIRRIVAYFDPPAALRAAGATDHEAA